MASPRKSAGSPRPDCPKPAASLGAQETVSEAPVGPAHKGSFSLAATVQGGSETHPCLSEDMGPKGSQAWSPPDLSRKSVPRMEVATWQEVTNQHSILLKN